MLGVYLKRVIPKPLIHSFDVFEKTAKNDIEVFFCTSSGLFISLSENCGRIPLPKRKVWKTYDIQFRFYFVLFKLKKVDIMRFGTKLNKMLENVVPSKINLNLNLKVC